MKFWGILSVAEFELQRLLSVGRMLAALFLILFPPGLVWMVQLQNGAAVREAPFSLVISFLILQVTCGMSLLAIAPTIISSEIESNTWVYIAARRGGRMNLVLGKYLVASTVAAIISAASATVLVMIAKVPYSTKLWFSLVPLSFLAAFSYGALFVLFGTFIQRRAMAAAVVYMLIVEGVLSLIPATANQFTINFRLRSLMANWMAWKNLPERMERFLDQNLMYTHLIVLGVMITVLLTLSLVRVRWGEYPMNVQD